MTQRSYKIVQQFCTWQTGPHFFFFLSGIQTNFKEDPQRIIPKGLVKNPFNKEIMIGHYNKSGWRQTMITHHEHIVLRWDNKGPQGQGHFGPDGCNLNNLDKGLLDEATYQISNYIPTWLRYHPIIHVQSKIKDIWPSDLDWPHILNPFSNLTEMLSRK